jgi:hypothetical protein
VNDVRVISRIPHAPRRAEAYTPRVGETFAILGYRGDATIRPVVLDSVKGDLFVCKCLVRSSPTRDVFRSYKRHLIEGVRPLIGHDED